MIEIVLIATLLQAQSRSTPPLAKTPPSADTAAIAVLRAQLQEAREYRADLLQTVNISLAATAGVGLLLIGFSWFANFRLLEREKTALQTVLATSLSSQLEVVKKDLAEGSAKSLDQIRAQALESAALGSKALSTKADEIEKAVASLNGRIDRLGRYQRLSELYSEARYWQQREVFGNELTRYQEILSIALDLKDENKVSDALSNMIRLGEAGTLPFWSFVPGITANLERLPPNFVTEKQRLIALLANVKRA
jgi:hypothetical protein